MPTQLIINADDFGNSPAINEAVAKAHQEGILTSTSLMVTGSDVDEAVSIAKQNPKLAVGLHITLSDLCLSVLPKDRIPDLVDENSCFVDKPITAGLKYHFNKQARQQIKVETEAQFDAFAATGLQLSHVDGHQHIHAHPDILPLVLELAVAHQASGIRVPNEPFWQNLLINRSDLVSALISAGTIHYMKTLCRRFLTGTQLATCDFSIGTFMSGRMTSEYSIGILKRIKAPAIEIYYHPACSSSKLQPLGPNDGDLKALLSPELKSFVQDNGFNLSTYPELKRNMETCSVDS